MEETQEFSINYWGKEFDYTNSPKKGKSIKGKLATIALFIIVLALTPAAILNLGKINLFPKKQITTSTSIISPTKEAKIASANNVTAGTVGKNDSYWRISKRYCGTGEFYLSIQEKNNFKALYEGDPITVVCR